MSAYDTTAPAKPAELPSDFNFCAARVKLSMQQEQPRRRPLIRRTPSAAMSATLNPLSEPPGRCRLRPNSVYERFDRRESGAGANSTSRPRLANACRRRTDSAKRIHGWPTRNILPYSRQQDLAGRSIASRARDHARRERQLVSGDDGSPVASSIESPRRRPR